MDTQQEGSAGRVLSSLSQFIDEKKVEEKERVAKAEGTHLDVAEGTKENMLDLDAPLAAVLGPPENFAAMIPDVKLKRGSKQRLSLSTVTPGQGGGDRRRGLVGLAESTTDRHLQSRSDSWLLTPVKMLVVMRT